MKNGKGGALAGCSLANGVAKPTAEQLARAKKNGGVF